MCFVLVSFSSNFCISLCSLLFIFPFEADMGPRILLWKQTIVLCEEEEDDNPVRALSGTVQMIHPL